MVKQVPAIPSQTGRAVTKFQLPAPVDAGTPTHLVKGEALLNSVIVLRGVGGVINAPLGQCRPVFMQFPDDFEDYGPVKGSWTKDRGEWICSFPDDDDNGVYQFLLSETSPALRVAKALMGDFVDQHGLAARIGVMRSQRSGQNAGFSYYIFDKPQDGDLYAVKEEVLAASERLP